MWIIREFCWWRELYEADFHKPGIYGSGRVWANAWDVFRRTPSRGGHGRRAAVDFVVFLGAAGFRIFVCFVPSNAHGLLQVWGRLTSFTSLLVSDSKWSLHFLPNVVPTRFCEALSPQWLGTSAPHSHSAPKPDPAKTEKPERSIPWLNTRGKNIRTVSTLTWI